MLLVLLIAGCSSQSTVETQQITSTPTVTPQLTAPFPPTPHPLAITVQNAALTETSENYRCRKSK